MFQWPKKVVKSVTFNPSVADESLLAAVEDYLEKLPDKTFSDICKQALWQSLCIPETVKPSPKTVATDSLEKKIDELQLQMADLEERFFAKQSHRLETIERNMLQLTQQMAYLVNMGRDVSMVESLNTQEVSVSYTTDDNQPAEEVDPLISRFSQILDEF